MIFLSAGHHKKDPGAVGCGTTEAAETIILRDLVSRELDFLGVAHIKDIDTETLSQYLDRIKSGNASVVCEIHFNAAGDPKATGTEVLIQRDADRLDQAMAKELAEATAKIVGIKNRGVLREDQTPRKSLGLMREQGIVSLMEICFISNPDDMAKYRTNIIPLSKEIAKILSKYENML